MTEKYLSPLVSCLTCREVKSAKGIFSHILSSHTEEGKLARIKAGKASGSNRETQKSKAERVRILYKESPNICICGNPKEYKQRNNKYCSASCGASHGNKDRNESGYAVSEETKTKLSKANKNFNSIKPKFTKISQCKVCSKFFPGSRKTCSTECCKKILSELATNNPKMGGNKNTRAYGWYESKYAGKVWLESSYEYKVAKSLDDNKISWIRPTYLKYGSKKYFADFYLPDFNIYLDPKNDHLIAVDTDKIRSVIEENKVKVLVLNKSQLSWEYIQTLL